MGHYLSRTYIFCAASVVAVSIILTSSVLLSPALSPSTARAGPYAGDPTTFKPGTLKINGAADATPATAPTTRPVENWQSLFDGKTLDKWKVADFAGHGEPAVEDANIVLPYGESLTGLTYTGELPKMSYEVELQAKKVTGSDFFCGLTFPVNDSFASLICGGWGGAVVGISSLDDKDANRNDTRTVRKFETDKWYTIRMRVMPNRLKAWIDGESVVDVDTTGKKVSTRVEIDPNIPFGIASFQTTAAFRDIRIRTLTADEIATTQPAK